MDSLEDELAAARAIDVDALAETIEAVGFECTRCGECCTADGDDPHTATVFPDEVRTLEEASGWKWDRIARPMPFGLDDDGTGETFEWALQTDGCGDCVFYEETDDVGACTVHEDRPLICQTYPFSLAVGETAAGPGDVVERIGDLQVHECEGVGRDIDSAAATVLAETLKRRAIVELEEAIGVRDAYDPAQTEDTVVYDSEGAKRPDGTPL
ncbi:MAG: YkgJ family cysteine cluster protein [Halanaeroarchaeum sp.]